MRFTRLVVLLAIACVTAVASQASAQTTFDAFLLGTGENPPNASPGTGFGQVVLNAAQTLITVDENWSGLTAPATASHIHGPAPVGMNAPVLFPFSGVPAATSGAIPTQSFAITPAQVADLQAGLYYMNVHTSTFPGGEIRGQLTLVPEPSTLVLCGIGVVGLVAHRRMRRRDRS
jgi:CHRD domain/PEP-CTERM motif